MGGTEDDKEGEEDVEMMWEVEDEEGGLVEVEMAGVWSRRWGAEAWQACLLSPRIPPGPRSSVGPPPCYLTE